MNEALVITKEIQPRIDALKEKLNTNSTAEVLANALAVYEYLVEESKLHGAKVYLHIHGSQIRVPLTADEMLDAPLTKQTKST